MTKKLLSLIGFYHYPAVQLTKNRLTVQQVWGSDVNQSVKLTRWLIKASLAQTETRNTCGSGLRLTGTHQATFIAIL